MGLPLYVIGIFSLTAFNVLSLFSANCFNYNMLWKGAILVMSVFPLISNPGADSFDFLCVSAPF
jgi:hypothetical protein